MKAKDVFLVTGNPVGGGWQNVVIDKELTDTEGQKALEILRNQFGHELGRSLLARLVGAGRFVTLRATCKEVPQPSNSDTRVFRVDIEEHTKQEQSIPEFLMSKNPKPPVLQRIEARIASRLLGCLEEIMVGVEYPHLFHAHVDGKAVPIRPDRLLGYMDEIRLRFAKKQDWSLLDLTKQNERKGEQRSHRLACKLRQAEKDLETLRTGLRHHEDVELAIRYLLNNWWCDRQESAGTPIWRDQRQYPAFQRLVEQLTDLVRRYGGGQGSMVPAQDQNKPEEGIAP